MKFSTRIARPVAALLSVVFALAAAHAAAAVEWRDRSPHAEGFVEANGVRLHYLDWGGRGETILFLTGMGTSPHIFDEMAPKFTRRFRVLGLTRRGLPPSDKPEAGYDTGTLAEDVRAFLDALKIGRATLVGWSLAGTEMTRFAALHPERVSRLVYLDSAYDYARFPDVWAKDPVANAPTKEDMASFEAARRWFIRTQGMWSAAVEADGRAVNLQPDGTVKPDALPEAVSRQLMAGMVAARPDFTKIRAPALAFYAVSETHPGIIAGTPPAARRKGRAYWREFFLPFQRGQMENFRRSAPRARVVELRGAPHLCFIRPRDEAAVVREMRKFLYGAPERRVKSRPTRLGGAPP